MPKIKDFFEEITSIKHDEFGRVTFDEVLRVTQLSRSTIWKRMKEGTFPPPLAGLGRRYWMLKDIQTYQQVRGYLNWQAWKPFEPHSESLCPEI